MRVPSLTRWGPPQTRPGWGMEPAPERKGVGGAGKQQGGKAEQIRATRYHVTQTEGGEISREPKAEPIAESRACTRAGARSHIEPHQPPGASRTEEKSIRAAAFWCASCPPECRFSSCAFFYCGLYDTKLQAGALFACWVYKRVHTLLVSHCKCNKINPTPASLKRSNQQIAALF